MREWRFSNFLQKGENMFKFFNNLYCCIRDCVQITRDVLKCESEEERLKLIEEVKKKYQKP